MNFPLNMYVYRKTEALKGKILQMAIFETLIFDNSDIADSKERFGDKTTDIATRQSKVEKI